MTAWRKIAYGLDGLVRRQRQERVCPSCGSRLHRRLDRKGFHELMRCEACALLYRWPHETPQEMALFYQDGYSQAGLTTDLPDPESLRSLLATRFRGSAKDFSRIVRLLRALSVPAGAQILDFGANWGYGVWQLRQAGFSAIGYEISGSRARYAEKLSVEVATDWADVEAIAPFDVVLSSHVLEHTGDPAQAIRQKLSVLAPDGWLIALFPNGSDAFRKANPAAFHRLWGQVHPVMLSETFVRDALAGSALAVGACGTEDFRRLEEWDRQTSWTGTLTKGELMMVCAHRRG